MIKGAIQMAVKTIYEMFDIVYNDNFLDLTITGTDINGDDQTIITDTDAKSYIRQKYATRLFPVILGDSASLSDAKRTWQEIYTLYLTNHLHGINKQMQALFDYNYSPIENVDRYETETTAGTESGTNSNTKTNNLSNSTQYGRTETNSGTDTTTFGHVVTESGTDTIRRTGNDTLEKDGSIINTTEKAGYNAPNSYTADTKTTESYNNYSEDNVHATSDATTFGHTDTNSGSDSLAHGHVVTNSGTDTESQTGTVTDAGETSGTSSTERTLHTHGNIGVTTNNQLIEAEIEMRKLSLAEMIIDDIINDYTYYS